MRRYGRGLSGLSDDIVREAPGSGAVIAPASWRDLNAVRHLEQACFPRDAWPLLDMISILSFPNVVRLKAVLDGRLVGFIAADVRARENLAWIATVGVLPEFQGRGFGRALLEGCEARLTGLNRVRLSVRMSNEQAIRLYERAGYEKVGSWGGYYTDGEDALVMEKILG